MTDLLWSGQQAKALSDVAEWLRDPSAPQVYRLFGYAGTGKTTLAQHLAADVRGNVFFAAFTGKAASVLRQKGCPGASTLHSLIYDVGDRSRERLWELQGQLAETKDPETRAQLEFDIKAERRKLARPFFIRNEESPVRDAALVVLDECSMVDKYLGDDLLSFGKKVLVLGDPAQLPPIKGGGYFTNQPPNLLLTEIHRQALDSPILRFATAAREGRPIAPGCFGDSEDFARKISKKDMTMTELALSGSQLLTGKNETRRALNRASRAALGFYDGPYPKQGERLVVLKNDRGVGVLNGVVCTAESDAMRNDEDFEDETLTIHLRYEGQHLPFVDVDRLFFDAYDHPEILEQEEMNMHRRPGIPMDFGYALTVHKSQGSQWDDVTLCDDGFAKREPRNRQRWLYTAITRAARRLTIIQ